MKKPLVRTPWFGPHQLPVREGLYEVMEKPPFLSTEEPKVIMATWEYRLGQLGFWVCSKEAIPDIPGATHSVQRLLTILGWRGVLHPRVELKPEFKGLQLKLDLSKGVEVKAYAGTAIKRVKLL